MVTNNLLMSRSLQQCLAHEYVESLNEHGSVLMRVPMLALFLRYLFIRIFFCLLVRVVGLPTSLRFINYYQLTKTPLKMRLAFEPTDLTSTGGSRFCGA